MRPFFLSAAAVAAITLWLGSATPVNAQPVDAGSLDTEPSLVAWWKLEETSGLSTADAVGGGHAGTLVGGPSWGAGRFGGALSLDGVDDRVTVADAPDLMLGANNADFSISFWLYLAKGSSGSWRNMFRKGTKDADRTGAMWLYPTNNRIHARVSTTYAYNEGTDSASEVPVGVWTHVAYVKAGNTLSLYLNGRIDAFVTLTGQTVAAAGPLSFGKDPWYAGVCGTFDDVRVYSRGLTPPEVSSLANPGLSPVASVDFMSKNITARGDWWRVSGSEGYVFAQGVSSLPAYCPNFNLQNNSNSTWSSSTPDPRALLKPDGSGRFAACWYGSAFDIKLGVAGEEPRPVTVSCLDWDGKGTRGQRFDVVDAATGLVLDSRATGPFQDGQYLTWSIQGDVILRVTRTAGSNAVVAGVFFGEAVVENCEEDSDGDDVSNADEYLIGSDPLVAPDDDFTALPTDPSPGLAARYYSTYWTMMPDFVEYLPFKSSSILDLNCPSSYNNLGDSGKAANIGAIFTGWINIPAAGRYTLHLTSDDGSALYFGPKRLIDNDGSHGMTLRSGSIDLAQGMTPTRVEFFQGGGPWGMTLEWEGPGIARQPVPSTVLFHNEGNVEYWRQRRDIDSDMIRDLDEFRLGTNPLSADSDGDGMPDGWEVAHGLNPLVNDANLDPDGDCISNLIECKIGSQPEVAPVVTDILEVSDNMCPGVMVKEYLGSWSALPNLAALQPARWSYAERLERVSPPTEELAEVPYQTRCAVLHESFLDVPEQGEYTFTLWSQNGGALWLDGALVFNDKTYHSSTKEVSGKITLAPGLHTIQAACLLNSPYFYANNAVMRVYWTGPAFDKRAIPRRVLRLPAAMAEWLMQNRDMDGDGVSSRDEIVLHHTRYDSVDTDEDGLADGDELRKFGTDALKKDTDGDGINDYREMFETFTNPTVADSARVGGELVAIAPSSFTAQEGAWSASGTEAVHKGRIGWVEYDFNLPAAGHCMLEVSMTQDFMYSNRNTHRILSWIDGDYIGSDMVDAPYGSTGVIQYYLPHLAKGAHHLKLLRDNVYDGSHLRIKSIRFRQLAGDDFDGNGEPDWITTRLDAMCGVDTAPAESRVSPVCVEGRERFIASLKIDDDSTALRSTLDKWYADITLDPVAPKTVEFSFQSGARTVEKVFKWTATNLFESGDIVVRQGDSLLLNAFPIGETAGAAKITMDGVARTSASPASPLRYDFPAAGAKTLAIAWTSPTGVVSSKTVKVTAVSRQVSEIPATWRCRKRSWTWNGLSDLAAISADGMTITESSRSSTYGVFNLLRTECDEDVRIAARLGEGGPILAVVPTAGFYLRSGVDGSVRVIKTNPDGSVVAENTIVAHNLPSTVRVYLKIFVGGVVFEDGTIEKNLTRADFSPTGEYVYRLIRPVTSLSSVCHTTQVYQGTTLVGNRESY